MSVPYTRLYARYVTEMRNLSVWVRRRARRDARAESRGFLDRAVVVWACVYVCMCVAEHKK